MEQFKEYFVADASWDKSIITKIFVERETDKSYLVHHTERLLGYQYIGKRIRKGDNIFSDFPSALQYLIKRKEESIKRHYENLKKLESGLAGLIELKDQWK